MTPPHNKILFEETRPEATPVPDAAVSVRTKVTTKPTREKPSVAIDEPRLLILASAGSGKTFQLTNRYLTLLRTGALDRILATTFTRKAAGEIFERVLRRLADAALHDASLQQLQQFVGLPVITREECLSLLKHLTRHLHRARIGTLDSVFAQMAGSHALELGMPPGWRLMESVDVVRLTDQAIETVLRQSGREEAHRLMHMLSKGQNSRRVHDLIRETVHRFTQPYLITNEAAWKRLDEGVGRKLSDLELEGAIAVLQSRRDFVRTKTGPEKNYVTAISKNIDELTDRAWDQFLDGGIPGKLLEGERKYYSKEIPAELIAAFHPLMEHAKAMVAEVWANQTRGTWQTLDRVHTVLRELKAREGRLSFDDIPRLLSQRLSQQSVDAVGYRLDARIDHLLLDEFQDTSLIQWNVLRPFATETTVTPSKTFFCVGDKKQAIYSFRGGNAAIFDTLQGELHGVQMRTLDESRRSSPAVIEAVNRAFSSLVSRDDFEALSPTISDWCEAVPLHTTARRDLPGYVRLEVAGAPEPPEDASQRALKDEFTEQVNQLAAQRIAEFVRDAPGASIGVLVRGNERIRGLAHELRQLGVEFSEEGGSLILDSAAVQLLMSVLRIADHPGDRVARFHVANSPLAEQLQLPKWDDDTAALTLSEHLRGKLLADGYVPTLQRWVLALMPSVEPRDKERLRQLLELAERHVPTARPRDFLRWVENERVENRSSARVQLMTIHKSKGLEFDIVVLPDLDTMLTKTPDYLTASPSPAEPPDRVLVYRTKGLQRLLPPELQQAYAQTEAAQVVDNMCVHYVAMTRAVHALHLILPTPRYGGTPKTVAGLLQVGLGNGQTATPLTTLFECGDPLWFQRCPELTVQPPAQTPVESILPQIEFAPLTGGRRRGMERIIPSQMAEKATKVRVSSVLKLDEATGGIDRGTLFHAWFERVGWLEDGRPEEEELRKVAVALGAEHLNIDRCLSQFQSLLRLPQVALALSRRSYQPPRGMFSPLVQAELSAGACELELDRERRFAVGDAGQLISGMIDRLVLIRRNWQVLAADLLDFKTDALPGDDATALQDKVATYRDQMRSYARAIAKIYKLSPDRVSTRLVMLATGRVEVVEA